MAKKCQRPIINIGSINQSRDTRNFLDFQERKSIWESAIIGEFGADTLARTSFIGQEDLGNPVRWASAVEQKVSQVIRLHAGNQIGRASCRERVCQFVSISVVAGSIKKTK